MSAEMVVDQANTENKDKISARAPIQRIDVDIMAQGQGWIKQEKEDINTKNNPALAHGPCASWCRPLPSPLEEPPPVK